MRKSLKQLLRKLLLRTHEAQLLFGLKRVILIHAHMRSGSSLLANLLNENPDIIGIGEVLRKYHSIKDFNELIRIVNGSYGKIWGDELYTMDKVVFTDLVSESVLRYSYVYNIFIIRNPEETLPSWSKFPTHIGEPKISLKCVSDQYINRLQSLCTLAGHSLKERALFITYRQLIHETDHVFRAVEQLLNLKTPLSEEYTHIGLKSKHSVGDPSPTIQTGRIVRRKKGRAPVTIPEDLLDSTNRVYTHTRDMLARYCQEIS